MSNAMWSAMTVLVCIGILLGASRALKEKKASHGNAKARDLRARKPLTAHEEKMFVLLRETFPHYIVLAQVSFSALLDTKNRLTRNTFNQKTADFVLCDNAMNVLAIIELDDSSHKNRERQDAARDELFTSVGYRVVRYPRVPEARRLSDDMEKLTRRN